jgi:hypothetical protein
VKRPGEKEDVPGGGKAERRFRLFEASRGLFGRRSLRVEDETPSPEPAPGCGESPRDEDEGEDG